MTEGRRLLTFLAVGALNTLVGYGLFAGLVLLGAKAGFALAGATILGVLFNFQSIGRAVFSSRDLSLLPRFVVVYLVLFLLNLGALQTLSRAELAPLPAQALLCLPFALLSFLAMRHYVFRDTRLRLRDQGPSD